MHSNPPLNCQIFLKYHWEPGMHWLLVPYCVMSVFVRLLHVVLNPEIEIIYLYIDWYQNDINIIPRCIIYRTTAKLVQIIWLNDKYRCAVPYDIFHGRRRRGDGVGWQTPPLFAKTYRKSWIFSTEAKNAQLIRGSRVWFECQLHCLLVSLEKLHLPASGPLVKLPPPLSAVHSQLAPYFPAHSQSLPPSTPRSTPMPLSLKSN